MENPEDEEMGGDGVVTMRHVKKIIIMENINLHVKEHIAVKPGKACIPLVTH